MTEIVPPDMSLPAVPARDRRIVWTAVVSGLAHLLIFAVLLLPPLMKLSEPAAPQSIAVDIVTPKELASLEPSSSAPPPSSEQPVSSEPPSSSAPPESSEAPSASSEAASSEPASSAEPASSEPASSAEPKSSAEASSQPQDTSAASSAEAASSQAAPSGPPPKPMPAPPLVIPVGPSEPASDASTAPSELDSSEPDNSGTPEDGAAPASSAPAINGPLHVAKEFYASSMLQAPQLAATLKAIKALPRQRRIAQMCNLEALGQIAGSAGHFQPNALIADAFAAPVNAGQTVSAPGGAFRSGQTWYGVSFKCTVASDLSSVTAFSFRTSDALPGPPTRPAGQ